MKKITYLLITLVGLGIFNSCEKATQDPVLDMSLATKAAFTNPSNDAEFVFTQENQDSLLNLFSWSPASYNLDDLQATTYILQMDMADSNFVNKRELITTTETSFSITVGEMNSKLMSMGLIPDSAMAVEFRLISFLNTDTDYSKLTSNTVMAKFTTFTGEVSFPKLYVPGDYQGWAPATAPNVFDFDGDGVYNGYVFFPEGGTFQFKFTSDPDWDHTNYGAGATEFTISTDNGAGNLMVPGAGGYHLEIDINALTWNYGDGVENWGVIGEWLSWSSDINMDYDPVAQQLSVTVADIPAAANQRFKFRANDAWTINLGAKTPDDGTLVQGGADIPIPDGGTITFILRFTTPEPTYEIIK